MFHQKQTAAISAENLNGSNKIQPKPKKDGENEKNPSGVGQEVKALTSRPAQNAKQLVASSMADLSPESIFKYAMHLYYTNKVFFDNYIEHYNEYTSKGGEASENLLYLLSFVRPFCKKIFALINPLAEKYKPAQVLREEFIKVILEAENPGNAKEAKDAKKDANKEKHGKGDPQLSFSLTFYQISSIRAACEKTQVGIIVEMAKRNYETAMQGYRENSQLFSDYTKSLEKYVDSGFSPSCWPEIAKLRQAAEPIYKRIINLIHSAKEHHPKAKELSEQIVLYLKKATVTRERTNGDHSSQFINNCLHPTKSIMTLLDRAFIARGASETKIVSEIKRASEEKAKKTNKIEHCYRAYLASQYLKARQLEEIGHDSSHPFIKKCDLDGGIAFLMDHGVEKISEMVRILKSVDQEVEKEEKDARKAKCNELALALTLHARVWRQSFFHPAGQAEAFKKRIEKEFSFVIADEPVKTRLTGAMERIYGKGFSHQGRGDSL